MDESPDEVRAQEDADEGELDDETGPGDDDEDDDAPSDFADVEELPREATAGEDAEAAA